MAAAVSCACCSVSEKVSKAASSWISASNSSSLSPMSSSSDSMNPSFSNLESVSSSPSCQERISDSTKEQRGQGQTRNNGQGDHQSKALVKGCRERTRAWGRVSSQEKDHTNRDLARATAKSRAGRRQS